MDNRPHPGLSADIAAALDWWRDAGVDMDFSDAPADWLAPPESVEDEPPLAIPVRAAMPEEPAAPTIAQADLPVTLAAFSEWWLNEPTLDGGRSGGRVAPRGPAGAELMVIVPEPEPDDSDMLLSGPLGRLLDAMLAAMGLPDDTVYRASALPRHTPMADWSGLARQGIGQVLRHHVGLVRPKRLVAFGSNILPLLGHDPAHNPAVLTLFNHEEGNIPLLVARELAALRERPRWKAGLWQGWLDWTA